MEKLCEVMKKRHAMEYAKLSKECEEVKQRDLESENETNEQVEGKDQEWKIKFEEILTLMKEMSRGQKEEAKASTGDFQRMVQESCHPNDPEKMLEDYTEAATEELLRQKMEFSEVREKNQMFGISCQGQQRGEASASPIARHPWETHETSLMLRACDRGAQPSFLRTAGSDSFGDTQFGPLITESDCMI